MRMWGLAGLFFLAMRDASSRETTEAQQRAGETAQAVSYRDVYCDRNYGSTRDASGHIANVCVPADRDYDCSELHAMGIGDIEVVGSD